MMTYETMSNPGWARGALPGRMQALILAALFSGAATGALPPEVLEPEVTIEEFSNRTEEAYWVNQRRAAVKISPKHGAPYYIVDPDADGTYEMRRGGPDIDSKPSMWKVLQW
jgi:hypothetical protein